MSDLELHQRGLLELVKNRGGQPCDPYLRRVANSRELAMVRKIALWWRAFALEAQCHFTTRLLKQLGCFDALVKSFFDHNATSPFVEELSLDFLGSLYDHDDRLIRAMSQFELALLKTRAGSAHAYEIMWDRHPDLVVLALETGGELPACELGCRYRMHIARDLPHMIVCNRELTLDDRNLV
jgi:hypothetical protein